MPASSPSAPRSMFLSQLELHFWRKKDDAQRPQSHR
jgi:hypothetical protein